MGAVQDIAGYANDPRLPLARGLAMALLLTIGYRTGFAQAKASTDADPRQIASDAVKNETKVIEFHSSYLRYQVHTQDAKGDQLREVFETKDGTVARVMARGGRSLTPEEDAAEHARLQGMLDSPSAFQKHIDKDRSGKKFAGDLIRLLPDAMIFSFTPGQPQREHHPQGTPAEYVIDFKPNPAWSAPTMTSQALTGIQGRCWIDAKSHYLTRLEATIFQGVNLGFGFFAHIYPGGVVTVEQVQVSDDRWIVDRFTDHLTLRALMVKTVTENTDLYASDFVTIQPSGYQDAIHTLLALPIPASTSASR